MIRSTAQFIELIFGLFLISGLGFLYTRRRIAGWGILLLRLALLLITVSFAAEIHPLLGPAGMAIGWAVPPYILAWIIGRSAASTPQGQGAAAADLESLGWFGLGGIGWISAGHRAIGVTLLITRFLMLGAGTIFLPLFWLGAADACVDDGGDCTALRTGTALASLFWLALWLAFPLTSAALLRSASGAEVRMSVPRVLVWMVVAFLALFVAPALVRSLLLR